MLTYAVRTLQGSSRHVVSGSGGELLILEGDSFARSSDRFAQFDDSSVMSEFGNENKNKNSLSQVTEVVI